MRARKLVAPSDVIFTLTIAAAAIIFMLMPRAAGAQAEFRKNGELLAVLPLAKDNLYEIEGDYRNVFEIRDGKVSVRYTDCPNKSCRRMRAIDAPGEVIACAPNGVTVSIKGVAEGVDAVTG